MPLKTYQITNQKSFSKHICQFSLSPLEGTEPLTIIPGQYVYIYLNASEKAPFSVAGIHHGILEFHLKHTPDNEIATKFFDKLQSQETLQLSEPMGHCLCSENEERPLVFIAGGTGIAPHKAILDDILSHKDHPPITLYWGVSSLEEYYLKDWFEQLERRSNRIKTTLVLSNPGKLWEGASGLVHQTLYEDLRHELKDCLTLASGPYPMIMAIKQVFEDNNWPLKNLLSDMLEKIP